MSTLFAALGTLDGRRQVVQPGPQGSLPCPLVHQGLEMLEPSTPALLPHLA